MTDDQDLTYLRADLAAIESFLEAPGLHRLERNGFESRKRELREEIARLEARAGRLAASTLIFRGRPVSDSRGIDASFGAEAVQAYQRLVSTVAATRRGRDLGARGPLPEVRSSHLAITAVAHGSFGFELEELGAAPEHGASALRAAVEETGRLLKAAQESDEAFADVSELEPRVVGALGRFLAVVDEGEATVRITGGAVECALDTREAVQAAAQRTSLVRTTEADEQLVGVLLGLLPVARRFEYQLADTHEIVRGRVADEVSDPAILRDQWTGKPSVAHVRVATLQRPGREKIPRYVLHRIDAPSDGTTPPSTSGPGTGPLVSVLDRARGA